ncbi:MAG: Glycosyl transferase, group 2 family protein [uncultured Sulfurovum sp.]|uniref:Glycosyl transferase, group 2 family protein n=1 Tax=uncultured Sulfurovum sp. TaxID=269237 RepID=A0A6S6TXK7_9BACT|nr:MAG: Glycosyl transferase, group 2 family protein [uncultured Sulfurovum sp.]
MKILYVKANSERAREFQLKTIIYEIDGQKYVKKEAMLPEAIPHLKKMKSTYTSLHKSIQNPKIKLAKIINESETSLTFEFIEGISLASKYNAAKKRNKEQSVLDIYYTLLQEGFKTTAFDTKTMVTEAFKQVLGDFDYSTYNGQRCFDGISNIDLIFSNIIFKNENIYLIDYEWVYDFNIPIDFAIFRALHKHNDLHWKMEKHFVFNRVVGEHGFLNIHKKYQLRREDGLKNLNIKDEEIADLKTIISDKDSIISDKDRHISIQEKQSQSIISDKDQHIENQSRHIDEIKAEFQTQVKQLSGDVEHWHNVARTMTFKGRIKKVIKKVIPPSLLHSLIKQDTIENKPIEVEQSVPVNEYIYREPIYTQKIEDALNSFKEQPLISIIMPVYNVDPKWLDLAIESIEKQWYSNWELCLADDKSTNQATLDYLTSLKNPKIKVTFLEKNGNISIASNAALSLTSGTYVVLMDNDDEITPDALYEVIKSINETGAEFIYSDEDKIEMDGSYSDPHFKPDFAPDMFLSQNYLSHLGVIKKELITKVGGFTAGLEGSQDFDLYLKVLEHTNKIHHITKVLYHWRKIPGSTAAEYGEKSYAQEAGRKALVNAMERKGIKAEVKNGQTPGTYKVDYAIENTPLVSIIIPFKDMPELLTICVESILEKSTYDNFEIIGISNNSEKEETFDEMKRLTSLDGRIQFHEYNVPFNYSQINNYAVNTYAKGEQILFLNNDIEIITPTWIEEMLMYSQQKQNGAIGAKLYFPNDTIQHAGLIMAPKTIHSVILVYQGYPKDHYGYGSRLRCVNNYSAVTAACLMLKRSLFDQIDGFDAQNLSVAYNDVDLCLRLQEAGYNNIWTPYCEAYHHESISRGYEVSRASVERREKEKFHLKQKHPNVFTMNDPYYNKNLTRFSLSSDISESNKKTYQDVEGIDFEETIYIQKKLHPKKHHRVTLFSHFDADNEVKPYVVTYLKALSAISDVIFVSTAESINEEKLKSIEPYCTDILVKKNIGYDFGAWKSGLNYLGDSLNQYDALILCNDSVFGPLNALEPIFEQMHNYDVWSMTDNHEIAYHLQSYFMVYNKKAFTSTVFQNFWENFKIYPNKQMLIENNEIGYSRNLIDSNLKCGAYYSTVDRHYVNVLQYYWKELIEVHKFPFIKKEVLTTNPLQIETHDWKEVIQNNSAYDTELIETLL